MQLNRPFATVTPTLDGEVLMVMATAPDVTFTTGQIHRVLNNFSEEGIRKVLSRLALQGVVLADRVGNAFAYRLNTEHLAAEPIRALASLPQILLARIEVQLSEWASPPVYAAVFGSAVHGTMTATSDLDVLLVQDDDTPQAAWERQVGEFAVVVTQWTGNDARVVEYTVAGLRAARAEPMVRDVLDHGLTVAGTRAWLLQQLRHRCRSPRRPAGPSG